MRYQSMSSVHIKRVHGYGTEFFEQNKFINISVKLIKKKQIECPSVLKKYLNYLKIDFQPPKMINNTYLLIFTSDQTNFM